MSLMSVSEENSESQMCCQIQQNEERGYGQKHQTELPPLPKETVGTEGVYCKMFKDPEEEDSWRRSFAELSMTIHSFHDLHSEGAKTTIQASPLPGASSSDSPKEGAICHHHLATSSTGSKWIAPLHDSSFIKNSSGIKVDPFPPSDSKTIITRATQRQEYPSLVSLDPVQSHQQQSLDKKREPFALPPPLIPQPNQHQQQEQQQQQSPRLPDRTLSFSTTGKYLAALSRGAGSFLSPDMDTLESNAVTAEHMRKLIGGYARFRKTYSGKWKTLFEKLKSGQSPKIALIGCCDSRVDPAIITDCEPGDLFVVRNVANLVPPYSPDKNLHGVSAAIEFAVKKLKVDCIIVLGHSHCGGIDLLLNGEHRRSNDDNDGGEQGAHEGLDFLESWVQVAQKAKEKTQK